MEGEREREMLGFAGETFRGAGIIEASHGPLLGGCWEITRRVFFLFGFYKYCVTMVNLW